MKGFVEDSVTVFSALNNIEVRMPQGFTGTPPALKFEEGRGLTLEMNDAIVFAPDYVTWIRNSAVPNLLENHRATVRNGRLELEIW